MKFFPLLAAAFALQLVVALLQDSNSESDSSQFTLLDEFMAKYGVEMGPTEVPEALATPDSASGSGFLRFESFEEMKFFILSSAKVWSAMQWKAMNDRVMPNLAKFHEFEKKMNETNALVAKIKKMSESESIEKLSKLSEELTKKTDEVERLVSDSVRESSQKMSEAGEMTMEEFLEMMSMNTVSFAGSDDASTEGSDESSITQTSVESATQSSPSFQKAWDKLAGSAPAGKSTK